MGQQLRWGGLTFDGGEKISTPYTLATMTGFGGVGIKREKVGRESAHGNFSAPGFLEARPIGWGGLILTDSPEDQDRAIRALSGMRGLKEASRLVSQGAKTRWADVERADIPDPEILVYGKIASYKCSVEAPDPFLYGETHTFVGNQWTNGGKVETVPMWSVFHYGNADAIPSITITGAMPSGYSVVGPGGTFIVSQALTAGVTHRLDFRNGWLFRNEVLQRAAVTRAETFVIPPGIPSTVSLVPASGTGVMTVKVLDTDD